MIGCMVQYNQCVKVSFIIVETSKHYNAKVSLEHQLPTATQKLKTTDECVVSSLISLVTCTGKVCRTIYRQSFYCQRGKE